MAKGEIGSGGKNEMLGLLKEEQVFTIKKIDSKFRVRERCDRYFSVMLTGEQLKQLGREILLLAKT